MLNVAGLSSTLLQRYCGIDGQHFLLPSYGQTPHLSDGPSSQTLPPELIKIITSQLLAKWFVPLLLTHPNLISWASHMRGSQQDTFMESDWWQSGKTSPWCSGVLSHSDMAQEASDSTKWSPLHSSSNALFYLSLDLAVCCYWSSGRHHQLCTGTWIITWISKLSFNKDKHLSFPKMHPSWCPAFVILSIN